MARRDLAGQRFGKLRVLAFAGMSGGHALWTCVCDCGREKRVFGFSLTKSTKPTRSCGCAGGGLRVTRNPAVIDSPKKGERVYVHQSTWRIAALRALGNACQKCGWSKGQCDVHHRVAKRDGGLHVLSNAMVLCPNCHRLEHEAGHDD